MTYPVLAGAVVLTTANRRLRFREAAGAVGNVDLDVGTYYLRGGYTTNLQTYSEEFDNGSWGKVDCSITANATTAPDGTLTADRFNCASTASLPYMYGSVSFTGTFTISIYAKRGTHNFFQFCSTATIAWWANFDVLNGLAYAGGTTSAATITDVGHGWYRCTATITDASANQLVIAAVPSLTSPRADLSTLSTNFFLWGVQIEQGSSANQYVKTTTAAASGPTDELTYQIKTKLDAFGAGGNTYDVTMSRNIDPASPHSRMTITRSAGTSTFGLVVDGSQTFDMSLIGFSASTLNDANAKTSPFACAANWVSNDIPREIESFSERVIAVPRAVSGRVQGVTRSSRMQSWRLGLAFVDRRRMLIEEALDGAQDTLEGFLERFGATASIEMWLAPLLSGTTLQGLQSSNLVDVVQASEETLSRFEPQRLGPGVPLYSIDLRLHAKV